MHALPLRGKLFGAPGFEAQPLAVGDRVRVRLEGDGGAIEERLARTSKLARARRGEPHLENVIAANVSLALVLGSIVEPPFQPELIDSILAGAEREKIEAALVMTKVDRDRKGWRREWIDLYRGLGYRVFETSIAKGKRTEPVLAELAELLRTNTTVLCGASGVGKSSLMNALHPGLDLRVGTLSRIRQGRHTTSHTQLAALPGGGHVLDTPGIRAFGLWCVDPQAVQFWFRELVPMVGQCEYRNCFHLAEPGCAVTAAVEDGAVHPSRYASYAALVTELKAVER